MSDSDTLLAYMCEREVDEDGNEGAPIRLTGSVFAQNLKTAAATIGWVPDHLSEVMQELVAEGRVEPDHDDGDPARFANSRWRVVGEDEDSGPAETDLDAMKGKQLAALAKRENIEIPKSVKKVDEVREHIREALATPPAAEDEPKPLGEMTVDELIQYAGEHEIDLPEGDASQEELVEYITEAQAEAEDGQTT